MTDDLPHKQQYYRDIIETVEFPGFEFVLHADYDRFYLQIRCNATGNITGKPMEWSGRKWRISQYMSKSELVQTAFKAVLTATEHEVREKFKYQGQPIFDPHYDVDQLHKLRSSADALEVRS